MSHTTAVQCGGCDNAVLAIDNKVNCDGRIYHQHCCKCKDCGIKLSASSYKKSTDYLDDSFVLCQKHYDQRFKGKQLTRKGVWQKSGAPTKKAEAASNPMTEDAPAVDRRQTRSLFAPVEEAGPPPSEVDTSFLDEYSPPPVQHKKASVSETEAQPEPAPAAPVNVVKAFDDGSKIFVNYEFRAATKSFSYEVKNEKGESFRTTKDNVENLQIYTTKVSEKVFLIATCCNDVPSEYTFQLKNERFGGIKTSMDFSGSSNVRNRVSGGDLSDVPCSAMGNGKVTDVCTLEKEDYACPPEVFVMFSLPRDLNLDMNRPRPVRTITEEDTIFAAREASNTNFSVLSKDDLPLVGGRTMSHSIDDEPGIEISHFKDVTSVLRDRERLPEDFKDRESLHALLDELIASQKVLLFSKVRDQYCMEVERVLMSLGVAFSIVDVDTLPDMKMVLDRLDTLGGVSTAPHLFVDGTSIGSCNTVKRFEKSLDLHVFLARYVDREKAKLYEEERIRSLRFLYFPVSVDNRAARVVDVFVFIYAIVCAGTYENPSSKWAVLALAIDLIVRCIGGPEASVQGMIGAYAVSGLRPNFVPGRPKHFSATMSMMLAVIAAILYLSAGSDYSVKAGGIAVLIILAVGCLISFAFNFDIGVWLYGVAFKLRLTRDDAFRPHIHLLQDKNWEYDFNRDAATFKIFHSQVHNRHVLLPGQTELSEIDLVRKNRLETEFKLQDHSYVRHVKIDLFACPMAIAALAHAFKVTDVSFGNRFSRISLQWGTKLCADALSIISVICFGCILILYLLKCAHYPRKVLKEFHHPVLGSFFIAPAICLVLYGLLMYDFYIEMALILTWFGAFPLMLMSVNVVASLVYDYHSEEVVTPALMMLPVGCFLSSLALSTYGNDIATDDGSVSGINYILVSRLWFAVGALFAFTFFVCTFNASFFKSFADVRERPYLWLWMAASAAAGPAYILANNFGSTTGFDIFYHTVWLISVGFFAMAVVGFARGFFTFVKDVSVWNVAFASSLVTMNTAQYHSLTQDTFTFVLFVFSMAFSCYLSAMCFLITLGSFKDKTLFKPKLKWGPASFLNLTHEAFRYSILGILKLLNEIKAENLSVVNLLISELKVFFKAYREHSMQEEEVVFPMLRVMFPGLETEASQQHEQSEKLMDLILGHLVVIKNGASATAPSQQVVDSINAIRTHLPSWCHEALEHLRHEESTVLVVIRKYMPIQRQKEAVRRAFEITTTENWSIIVPYLLRNLPVEAWKVRLVRSLVWSMPERAQELGLIIYRGTDSVLWSFLCSEVPEITPRGLPGFKRIY